MKKLLLIPALALSLGGCGAMQKAVTAPGSVAAAASHTAADEEALKRCETTYKLTRTLMEMGVDSGLIHGSAALRVAKLDNELYGVLQTCRTAYRLFGSTELSRAADDMDKQAADVGPTIKEGTD